VPRRTRRELVGRVEDRERLEREREYRALMRVLRCMWRQRQIATYPHAT
jgi:hypothetical protein